jgi:hypothetical protein
MLDLRHREAWLAGAFWLSALIAVGSLLPGPVVATVHVWDKLEHAGAYAVLTLWLAGMTPRTGAWRAALFSMVFGALIEVAQGSLTDTRMFDPADLAAASHATPYHQQPRCSPGKKNHPGSAGRREGHPRSTGEQGNRIIEREKKKINCYYQI